MSRRAYLLACLLLANPSLSAMGGDLSAAAMPLSEHVATARLLASIVDGETLRVADTHSMEPVLSAQHLLVVQRSTFDELKEGDVVVFMRRAHWLHGQFLQRGWVGHRIVEKRTNYAITKGDNPSARVDRDNPTAKTIRGRVVYAVNGQTGEIRDMRASRAGEPLMFNEIVAREHANSAARAAAHR